MGNASQETDSASRPGVNWSYRELSEFISACYDRDTILDVLMGYAAYWFPARMTLIVGRSWVQLFAADGFDLSDEIDRNLRRADVDPEAEAVAQTEAIGTAEELGLGDLFTQLELDAGLLKSVGIEIGGRVAIVIVGAVRTEVVDTSNLADAARIAGEQLEQVIRMAKADTLPPPAQRIPAFPDPARPVEEETRKAPTLSDPTRRTQQLDLDQPSLARNTISGAQYVAPPDDEDDEDEDEQLDVKGTSFGLPFATKVQGPNETLLAGSGASDPAESEASEADSPETYVGAPVPDDKFPGEIDQPEKEDEVSEGVSVVPPRDVGGDTNRTNLGGLVAQSGLLGREVESSAHESSESSPVLDESEASSQKVPADPNHDGDVTRTAIGGLEGETRLVNQTLERARDAVRKRLATRPGDDATRAALEAEEKQNKTVPPPGTGAWVNPGSAKGSVPEAMILKPARRRRAERSSDAKSTPAGSREPRSPGEPTEHPLGQAIQQSGREEKPTPKGQAPGGSPVRGGKRGIVSSSKHGEVSNASWGRDEKTRAADPLTEPAKDDWFDYFADDLADGVSSRSEKADAMQFSISEGSEAEPHSLPPETLERLLDSGPQMVDMQEAFLILDSRDVDRAFEAAESVAELGKGALEVLDLMFPGRVFIDRYQHPDDLPPVNEHGPLLHALVRIGDAAVEVARRHINDSSNETRFYATFLFTRLNAETALGDLFARLFDRDGQIRKLAADILLDYQNIADFDRHVRKPLRAELLSGEDLHVEVAARLIGRLRDADAVMALIDTMEETESPKVRQSVRDALKVVTLHSWSSPYEWRHWWEKARDESRTDWLAQALESSDRELRMLAFEEVRRIPGLDLNYHPDQPPKLRQRAQKELRSWFKLHKR